MGIHPKHTYQPAVVVQAPASKTSRSSQRTLSVLLSLTLTATLAVLGLGTTRADAAGSSVTSWATAPAQGSSAWSTISSRNGRPTGAGQVANNWFNEGTQRDKWMGALTPSAFGLTNAYSNLVWCIEAGDPIDTVSWSNQSSPAVSYLLWKWESENNPQRRAAIQLALYYFAYPDMQPVTYRARANQAHFYPTSSPEWQMAQSMWTEAQQNAGTPGLSGSGYMVNTSFSSPYRFQIERDISDHSRGSIRNVGARNGTRWVPGFVGTLSLIGPAVFADTGTKTRTVTTTSSGQTFNIKASDTGLVRAEFVVSSAPGLSIQRGSHSTRQDAVSRLAPLSFDGTSDTQAFVTDFRPVVTTQVVNDRVQVGGTLGDRVTFAAAVGDSWARDDVTAEFMPVDARYTIYGPFESPLAEAGSAPSGAPVFSTGTYRKTGGPGAATINDSTPVVEAGFYTWVWEIRRADQPAANRAAIREEFRDRFFRKAETTVVPWTPRITSQVEAEYLAGPGIIRDTINVTDLPDGLFAGGHGWGADSATISHTLYRSLTGGRPTDTTDLADLEAVDSTTTPAVNGVVQIELEAPGTGWYVVVSRLNVSDRVNGVLTSTGDVLEQVGVWSVTSTALGVSRAGDEVYDIAHVDGPALPGAYLTFEVYAQHPSDDIELDELVVTTERVEVEGPGDYRSPGVALDAGLYYWVEVLHAPDGTVIHRGQPRTPSETSRVVAVTSTAVAKVYEGEPFYDTAHIEGAVGEGWTLGFELWQQNVTNPPTPTPAPNTIAGPDDGADGEGDLDDSFEVSDQDLEDVEADDFTTGLLAVEVAGVIETDVLVERFEPVLLDGAGDYQSPQTIQDVGTYYWREVLFDADGQIIHRGEPRLAHETTLVVPEDDGGGSGAPGLPQTGSNAQSLALIAAGLLGLGIAAVTLPKRQRRPIGRHSA